MKFGHGTHKPQPRKAKEKKMAKKQELKVEYLPIEELKPYAGNAKLHPAEQIEQIKKSIQQFGMNDPIAIWKDGEIIEGHGRLIACTELKMKEIPVIRLDGLTDEQRRAYGLVHNKLTMNTGFDLELLNIELESLVDCDLEKYGLRIKSISEVVRDESTDEKEIRCPRCGKIMQRK